MKTFVNTVLLLWLFVSESLAFNCQSHCIGQDFPSGGYVKGSGPTCTGGCEDCPNPGAGCTERKNMDDVSGCWTGKYQCCCSGETNKQRQVNAAIKLKIQQAAALAAKNAHAARLAEIEQKKQEALSKAAAAAALAKQQKFEHEQKLRELEAQRLAAEAKDLAQKRAEEAFRKIKEQEIDEKRKARLHDLAQRKLEQQLIALNQTNAERMMLRNELMMATREAGNRVRKRYGRVLDKLEAKMLDAIEEPEDYERLEALYERMEKKMVQKVAAAQLRVAEVYAKLPYAGQAAKPAVAKPAKDSQPAPPTAPIDQDQGG